jgi:hypothetical protein
MTNHQISTRRATENRGNNLGLQASKFTSNQLGRKEARLLAGEAAKGQGSDASAVPERWRRTFTNAFVRGVLAGRKDRRKENVVEVNL